MDASNEQGFRCPKQECRKLFRKENLLMVKISKCTYFVSFPFSYTDNMFLNFIIFN